LAQIGHGSVVSIDKVYKQLMGLFAPCEPPTVGSPSGRSGAKSGGGGGGVDGVVRVSGQGQKDGRR
jgi:hypothetical protein